MPSIFLISEILFSNGSLPNESSQISSSERNGIFEGIASDTYSSCCKNSEFFSAAEIKSSVACSLKLFVYAEPTFPFFIILIPMPCDSEI